MTTTTVLDESFPAYAKRRGTQAAAAASAAAVAVMV